MDDSLEEYIMCTMVRGFSGTIPYAHGNFCIRPFRLWKRRDIEIYAQSGFVDFSEGVRASAAAAMDICSRPITSGRLAMTFLLRIQVVQFQDEQLAVGNPMDD